MTNDTIEIDNASGTSVVEELIQNYPSLTPEICQVYQTHQLCRTALYKVLKLPLFDNSPSFLDLVGHLVQHLHCFDRPLQEHVR